MQKPSKCIICRHYGIEKYSSQPLERCTFYGVNSSESLSVIMCRKHAVDLFKAGQKKFLLQHKQILVDLVDTEDKEFIRLLESTVIQNMDEL